MQRTGRLGTYAVSLGQEAVSVGVPVPCGRKTCSCPPTATTARCSGAACKMEEILLYWGGDERGNHSSGPAHDFPFCVPVGSQAPHAAGVAYAFKFRKEPRVAVCLFGDGATSKGDVYEAMNFAGVQKLPVVFVVNNNQWAISVPLNCRRRPRRWRRRPSPRASRASRWTATTSLPCAMRSSRRSRVARNGKGPRLIEALTYRLGDHTTADDAARYRSPEEVQAHWKEEPIARLRTYLVSQKAWSKAEEEQLATECQERVEAAVERYLARGRGAGNHVRSPLCRTPGVYAGQRDELEGAPHG